MKNRYLNYFSIIAIIFLFGFSFAGGAELNLQLEKTDFNIGESFSVLIYVDSDKEAINAVSGTISFPVDKLIVESVSGEESIFNYWSLSPDYSNTTGLVNFEGIVFNPGFIGPRGHIAIINFRTITEGSGTIGLMEGLVLANDGYGTNVLDGLSSVDFNISGTLDDSTELLEEDMAEPTEKDSIEFTEKDKPLIVSTFWINNLPTWLVDVINNHHYFFFSVLFTIILLLAIIIYLLYKLYSYRSLGVKDEER
ncbi:MAG TPA: hypothetical protein ENN31_00490 [Candidatus Vogelbacteria bacterium]|nr:hypothetical protein [Candidatus Vogelbacteria bacterium]